MRLPVALALALVAAPAAAGPDHAAIAERALDRAILPAAEAFAAATAALDAAAAPDCTAMKGEAVRAAWHDAFDAWMALQPVRFGPVEEDQRGFAVAFWPDGRGATGRTVARLLATEDPVVREPAAFAEASVAARGLHALERLLWDAEGPVALAEAYRCAYVEAAAADLARLGGAIAARWEAPWAHLMRSAGAPGNDRFLAPEEVTQRLYATLRGALEETAALRLGKPLGSFERPRPRTAETWRSGRSFRNVALILAASERMVDEAMAPALGAEARAAIAAAFDRAADTLARARDAGDLAEAVEEARIRVEAHRQAVENLVIALRTHLGPGLGVAEGFNAADGD